MCSAPAWLRRCCRSLRVPAVDPGKSRSTDTARRPPRLCYRVVSERWQCNRAASRHFPRTRPGGKATCEGHLSVAQVLNPGDLLPRTLEEERVLSDA